MTTISDLTKMFCEIAEQGKTTETETTETETTETENTETEIIATAVGEKGEYVLFPDYPTNGDLGETLICRPFGLASETTRGITDEYGDWIEDDEDGYQVKLDRIEGSAWAQEDVVEFVELEEVLRLRYITENSPYERYESYYTDHAGSYYIEKTDNSGTAGNESMPLLIEIDSYDWDAAMIMQAPDLDFLCEACNNPAGELDHIEFCSLPLFGKPIKDTCEIFSWDDTRLMRTDCNGQMVIEYREDREDI